MAAGNWITYDSFKEYLGDGTIDLDTHTFRITLHTSAYTPNRGTQTVKADLTNEVANGNGYTTNGQALTGVTWTQTGGTATFDATNPVWTASGGSITARYAVLHDDDPTSPADPLVAYCLLDTTPADVVATDTNTLTIAFHANGILTLSGAIT